MQKKSRFKDWEQPFIDDLGWAYPPNVSNIYHEERYGWRCLNSENLKLGVGCDIGCFTLIQAKYGVEIGDNVQIGPHSYICSWDSERDIKGKVIIGDNSLIGAYSMILPNSIIPPNSRIRARSILKNEDGEDGITWIYDSLFCYDDFVPLSIYLGD